jgi:hypothetical protein
MGLLCMGMISKEAGRDCSIAVFQEDPLGNYTGEVEMRQETELKGSHRSPDGT